MRNARKRAGKSAYVYTRLPHEVHAYVDYGQIVVGFGKDDPGCKIDVGFSKVVRFIGNLECTIKSTTKAFEQFLDYVWFLGGRYF